MSNFLQEMGGKITATFVRKRFQDSGKDQAPDYYVYEFTDIVDSNGKALGDKWIKETKLLKTVAFQQGRKYEITLSDRGHSIASANLPFPKEVRWDDERVYIKGGNSVRIVGNNKQEENLSIPVNKLTGVSNYETAALNKLSKGLMTEALLLKMNADGIFYNIHYCDPQDRRKPGVCSVGYSKSGRENQVLVQKETQAEIDRDLITIKRNHVTSGIEKHFAFSTEILEPKKKKK
jgi:hypothetical protein